MQKHGNFLCPSSGHRELTVKLVHGGSCTNNTDCYTQHGVPRGTVLLVTAPYVCDLATS